MFLLCRAYISSYCPNCSHFQQNSINTTADTESEITVDAHIKLNHPVPVYFAIRSVSREILAEPTSQLQTNKTEYIPTGDHRTFNAQLLPVQFFCRNREGDPQELNPFGGLFSTNFDMLDPKKYMSGLLLYFRSDMHVLM